MQQISFAPGRRVLVTGKAYSVTGITDNSAVHLLSDDNIERKVDIDTLFDWYQSGNLKPAKGRKKNPAQRVSLRTSKGKRLSHQSVSAINTPTRVAD